MAPTFTGFPPEGLAFLRDLEANNDREWFQPRKADYERLLRDPMLALAADVYRDLLTYAPAYATEPAKALYRIYRDTRFSKNKTPYKTHVAVLFSHMDLVRNAGAAIYLHVSNQENWLGGGIYMAGTAELQALRSHLADNPDDLRRVLRSKAVREAFGELQGDKTSRPPRGIAKDHPALDLLARKQWLLARETEPATCCTPEFGTEVRRLVKLLVPFVDALNAPLLQRHREAAKDPLRSPRA